MSGPSTRTVPVGLPRYERGRDPVGFVRRLVRAAHPGSSTEWPPAWTELDLWAHADPGSGAWDSVAAGAVAARAANGADVLTSPVSELLVDGQHARLSGDAGSAAALFAKLVDVLDRAPIRAGHPAAAFGWVPATRLIDVDPSALPSDWVDRLRASWCGAFAGAAFGAPLRGCAGSAIRASFGIVNRPVGMSSTPPDVGEVVESMVEARLQRRDGVAGVVIRGDVHHDIDVAVPLTRLAAGIAPPRAGWLANPLPDSTAAMRRCWVIGSLTPVDPSRAARDAVVDASSTNAGAGVDAAVIGALLVSIAFGHRHPHRLLRDVSAHLGVLPTQLAGAFRMTVDLCSRIVDPEVARDEVLGRLEESYWRQAGPNIASVVHALWFGEGDFTSTMAHVARTGLDTTAVGAVAGSVLGALNGAIPSWWETPLATEQGPSGVDGARLDSIVRRAEHAVAISIRVGR